MSDWFVFGYWIGYWLLCGLTGAAWQSYRLHERDGWIYRGFRW